MAPQISNSHRDNLERSIAIKATAESVWKALLKRDHFKKWSKAFKENSHIESEWKLGADVTFKDSNGNGIIGEIKVCKPYEELSIMFTSLLKDGQQDKESEKARNWIGCHESFFLVEGQSETILTIEEDVPQNRVQELNAKWDTALREIKSLAEELEGSKQHHAS
ncbi:MAG: SRPBCC domain-containing protein [Bacteriovoracaceae bacterium]|nr:SRPBCC domain-containing protein [Bacteriovoracaceae bacterium]